MKDSTNEVDADIDGAGEPIATSEHDDSREGNVEANRDSIDSRRSSSVADSIRYRRRAQAAESEVRELRADLESLQSQSTQAAARITELDNRLQLERRIARSGAIDSEAVRLLAEEVLKSQANQEIPQVIDDLRRLRPHLFDAGSVTDLTNGADGSFPNGTTVMAPSAGREPSQARKVRNAATQARRSGDGGDLMQYMRARRSAARPAGRLRP